MEIDIEIDAAAACGLVLQQARRSAVRALRVRNREEMTLVGAKLTITSDVGLFHPLTLNLDSVQPGETVSVPIPDGEPVLDYAFLSALTDVREAEVRASMKDATGEEIAFATARQTVYAPDQTLGCGRPIYYAAFVVPNCDAVARMQSEVGRALEACTGSAAITGYLHEKADVYNQCKAVYKAIQDLGLTYAVSPASFGQPGQKVRLPDDIVRYKTGCCLDTTLLFAAVFERCGLRPVVVLFRDHAVVGCHLTDKSFAEPVVSDAEVLRKAIQEDTFVAIETTRVGGGSSFAEAESSAKVRISEAAGFECAVDVALARGMGVHALPVAPGGGFGEVEGREVASRDEEARALTEDVDLDSLVSDKVKDFAEARVDGWAQRLLDLSKGNRLLNVRDTAKVVPIVCASPAALEDALAAAFCFRVKSFENFLDEEAGRAFQKLDTVAALEQYRESIDRALTARELWSGLTRRETDRRLKELYRTARVDLEESGVNTLFLTLGVLEWCEIEAPGVRYRAPILMVPIRIERRSVADGYRIRRLDEDSVVNTTLLEMLRREYKLNVPGLDPLPMDEAGCDVQKIFGIFRATVRDIKGLSVSEDCMIGQFSFGKFVMWKDITSRIDAVRSNPIVAHLISRSGAYDDGIEAFAPNEVDKHFDYAKVCCPLSADSSQLAAVLYSGIGKSFVLHGPPGTGKSQTITNIIAHNLSLGKRVLFVSEKKAALDVVYGRLAKLGLAPFCLQLHSNKSGKAEVYAQFSEVLKLGWKSPSRDWESVIAETEALRQKLDGYVKALHRQTVSGFTPYDLFTKLVRGEIDGDGSMITGTAREVVSADYELAKRALAGAAEMRKGIPSGVLRALRLVRPFAWSPTAESRLADEASRLSDEIAAVLDILNATGGLREEDVKFLARYFGLVKELRDLEKNLAGVYVTAELRKLQTKALRNRLGEIEKAFLPIRLLKERSLLKELAPVSKNGKLERSSIREVIRLAHTLQETDVQVGGMEDRVKKLLGDSFNPALADPVEMMAARTQAEQGLHDVLAEFSKIADIDPDGIVPDQAKTMAREIATNAKGNVRRVFMYQEARKRIPQIARVFAEKLDSIENPSLDEIVGGFDNSFQSKLLNEVMESDAEFGAFFGGGREADIARFCELDEKCAELSIKNLIARLSQSIPANDGRAHRGDTSELGRLMHECGKKIRQTPVRQMLAEAPTLIPAIKPCFLMSPLSVAQYLPVDAQQFDLVVFDEASQIPVWDAIGVIARGKQLIVVGDPKQLPPTSFFQKGPDEEEECEDLESVLDECLHAGIMSRFLGWHYRSRHESLIAFSNHRYYENKLHIFPAAALSERMGVSYVHVKDGVYEAGGSRTNRREAERVADIVFDRMSDPAFANQTIGVVTFSEAQRNLIEDMIDERRSKHPELDPRFAEQDGESFFVKNLENVQGDERDTIIFSIGYAPDVNGKFNMVFGPLSNQGGERRLNVAITRAREKIIVVSSIHSWQIDTDRTTMRGPSDLRAFLDYAEKGYRLALPCEDGADDEFAAEIASVLEKNGAGVVRNVGCGGNRVDVAVRDRNNDSKYLFGVVCDGYGYASELTTRDRDRLRDEVLSSLGWNVHHVWIVDWAYDRERAEKRLIEAFQVYNSRKETDK